MNEVSNDSWGRETSERGGTRRNEGWARGGNYNEATIQREVTRLGSQWKLGMDGHRDKLMWCWGGEGDDGWGVRWSRTEKRWREQCWSVETPLKKFLDGKSISWVSKRCQKVFLITAAAKSSSLTSNSQLHSAKFLQKYWGYWRSDGWINQRWRIDGKKLCFDS